MISVRAEEEAIALAQPKVLNFTSLMQGRLLKKKNTVSF
jgi:hypothetical protein